MLIKEGLPIKLNNQTMKDKIIDFITEQSCASVCCVDAKGLPYCFSCYYVFNAEAMLLYFKSSSDTTHAGILQQNPQLAGTILPDKLNMLQVRGIQFDAVILHMDDPLSADAYKKYHQKNPAALAMAGDVYCILLNRVKMTDSTLGFGKKINWQRANLPIEQLA